jgi:hypothetical protein
MSADCEHGFVGRLRIGTYNIAHGCGRRGEVDITPHIGSRIRTGACDKILACFSYRDCWPQPRKQKEIAAGNFLQKSGEATDKDSIHRVASRLLCVPHGIQITYDQHAAEFMSFCIISGRDGNLLGPLCRGHLEPPDRSIQKHGAFESHERRNIPCDEPVAQVRRAAMLVAYFVFIRVLAA